MLVTLFTAGLVAAGVVAGAGPLAVLSEPTSTESTTDPGTTSTESETTTESAPESTTTETETTTESTTTESTPMPSGPPTIASDKADYSPSELVTLSGTNWRPNEVVNIDVNDDQGQSWRRNVSLVANASGKIVDQFNLPEWFVATYRVVASGATSGVVTTSFTDGNVRVETNTGAPTVTLTYTQFAGTGCSGSVLAGPTTATISPTSGGTILFGQSTGSFRFAVPSSAGSQTFSQWTSQSSFSSPDNPLCFDAISGNRTFTANYVTSPTFNVTFDKSGIGGDTGSNVVLTVGSASYTASQLPVTLGFASGTSVTYAYSSPVSASAGKRYTLSGGTGPPSPFTVSANTAVTGTYGTQFQLSLATNPAAVGTANITGASSGDWFNSGAVLSLGTTTPVPFNGGNSRYVFTSWSGGASGSSNPVSVTMSAPRSVTANYGTEHKLTLATNPVAVGAGNLTGGTNGSFYAEGTILSLAATTPVSFNSGGSRYVFATWSGDTSGSSNPVSVTMGAPRSVTANYGTEHKLTVSTNPGAVGIGNLTGGTSGNFYAEGTILSLGATTPVAIDAGSQYRFDHWSGGVSGAATPVSVTMTGPKDVTANYVTQYKLTLATNPSGVGVGNISGGTNGAFYDAGTSLTLQATTPVTIDSTSRYRFDHWSGDASGSTNPVSVTVSGPTSVTANYVTQYKLTLATNPSGVGVGNISGGTNGAFYDAGTSLTLQATTPVPIESTSRYRFDHWSGDASGSTNPASVTMNAPKAVTADYVVQYLLTLSTSPEAGIGGGANPSASPSSASGFYDSGTVVNVSSDTTVAIDAGSRWRFDVWSGDASGSTTPVSVTMSAPRSVTAEYVKQFKLTLATSPVASIGGASNPSASPISASGFYDDGTVVGVSAGDPVAIVAGSSRWRFDEWSGDASGASNPTAVTLSAPRSVTAEYIKQFNVTFTQSGIGGDTGSNTVGTIGGSAKAAGGLPLSDWFDDGTTWSFESLVQTDPASGKRYSLTSAASGTISAAATVTGTYATQYRLNLATDPTAVGISNISGAADGSWHNAGASVTLTATTPVPINATSRYRFDHWSGGASGTANPVTFMMSAPKTVTANYVVQYVLTFGQSGITLGTGSNTVVTVDGSAKAATVLPFPKWYDVGATATFAYASPVFTMPASATQYVLSSVTGPTSPITVSGPATVTGTYAANVFSIQYLKPLDQTTDGSIVNTGKNGRVIPVKVQLFKDGVKQDPSTVGGDVTIKVVGAACDTTQVDPVEEYADAGSSNGNTNLFRWASDGWIYNLETTALGLQVGKCYRLDVYIGGASAIRASSSTYALFKPVK